MRQSIGCWGVDNDDIEAKIKENFGDDFARHECDVVDRGEFLAHPTTRRNLCAYRIEGVQDGIATFRIGREHIHAGVFAYHVLSGRRSVIALVQPKGEPIVMMSELYGKLVWDASPAQVQLTYWTTEVL
jgi:hypothetical protein